MLTAIEGRVLGALMEKQVTTPDQYPLSANALVLACNQATNREPVMSITPREAEAAIVTLKELKLARIVHPTHGRSVTKYRQVSEEAWQLEPDELAVMCLLLVRGPQTNGELRSRSDRLHHFESVGAVDESLDRLAAREVPLVERLERLPGQKEARWAQRVADEDRSASALMAREHATPGGSAAIIDDLRARVELLESRLARVEIVISDLLAD
jgi:uncharacterized protein